MSGQDKMMHKWIAQHLTTRVFVKLQDTYLALLSLVGCYREACLGAFLLWGWYTIKQDLLRMIG